MRTIGVDMLDHLGQEVTTVATAWYITRQDGVIKYFTDHDQDKEIEGSTYISGSLGERTAIEFMLTMAVSNMELKGFFNTDEISEVDVIAGKYNKAEIRFFIFNWADTNMPKVKILRGFIGNISSIGNIYSLEVRSLAWALQQNIGSLISGNCRSDFGDTGIGCANGCSYPIDPPAFQLSKFYHLDDDAAQFHVAPVTENGFQYRLIVEGTTGSSLPTFPTTIGDTFTSGTAQFKALQAIKRTAVITSVLDEANFSGDSILGDLTAFTGGAGSGAEIVAKRNGHNTWDGGGTSNVAGESGTVEITNGGVNYTDVEITAHFNDPITNTPVEMVSLDATVVDGKIKSVVFSLTVDGHKPVASSVTFTIVDSPGTGTTGYFGGGTIEITSGANEGIVRDVETFEDLGSGAWSADLLEPFPFQVEVGTTVIFRAECDRKFVTCKRLDNVNNFRGEDAIPGTDELLRVNVNV